MVATLAFDRTYEGLKLRPGSRPVRPHGHTFDRTYEGLKLPHIPLGQVLYLARLLTVPMRV